MTFPLLTMGVCFAVFAAVNFVVSLAIWGGRLTRDAADGKEPSRIARRLFVLRVLPFVAGLSAACMLALPSFLLFEPRGIEETPGATMVLLAVAGAAWFFVGLFRAGREVWAARRLSRRLVRNARTMDLPFAPAPAYRIRDPLPLVALVGIFRPRLFVAEQVLECLSARELEAVLAHEAWHARARDNAKRVVVRMAPALPWPAAARSLERLWEQAVEEACDDRANDRLNLAAALVKTARLATARSPIELPAASLHQGGPLARRIRRLVDQDPAVPAVHEYRTSRWLWVAVPAAFALAQSPATWTTIHQMLEQLVHLP